MCIEQWSQVSHVLDYIMPQPTKPINESPAAAGVLGEPEKPKRKPKKEKDKPQAVEQLQLFQLDVYGIGVGRV